MHTHLPRPITGHGRIGRIRHVGQVSPVTGASSSTHRSFVNTAKTTALLALLGGALVAAGAVLGSTTGAAIGLLAGLVVVGGSYWFSDRLAIRAARARPVTDLEAPNLYRIVRRLTRLAGLPMPAIYVSPAAQPNAFATGRDRAHAAVCVTAGLLELLDDDELEAVLAHELSHVANRDILIGSVAAALAMAITLLARLAMWGSMLGGARRRNVGFLGLFGTLAMAVLAPVAALLIRMGISRSREFEADHSGALLLGDGAALARALRKIDAAAHQVPMPVDAAHATAYIVNPLTGRQIDFAGLFRTHPPIEARLQRLAEIRALPPEGSAV